jgi:ElaB/YqjD/DUF883 family membrane-anchored ribosome-binding protein
MTEKSEAVRDKLVDDFAAVLGEAEEMLKRAATETGEKARDLRTQVETKLLQAKLRYQEIEGQALDQAKAAARATDDYVHDHPWQSIGIAAAIGVCLGLLLNRRN